jgi:hypothetical protein
VTGAERLAAVVREEGGLLADALAAATVADPLLDGVGERHALVLAAVREGYLLHYAEGRVVRPADPDLALLGGDRLYALGLAQLAQAGDLDAVGRLADLISECARAHAENDPDAAAQAWRVTASAFRG